MTDEREAHWEFQRRVRQPTATVGALVSALSTLDPTLQVWRAPSGNIAILDADGEMIAVVDLRDCTVRPA